MQVAIGLTFPGTLKDEAVICDLCKKFNVNVIIIEASFSNTTGWAILKVEGEEDEVKRSLDFLGTKNIRLQKIETQK
ncbi:MAG: NIL domain-containing protein [Candidatus Omnitrophica bacterium]|nr:NIL domain-containing protein [Candidatus Omnitrophota bacterium]MBU1905447.1 NIL domain-containing protein [Candidatus Omnitrophota bacterium]